MNGDRNGPIRKIGPTKSVPSPSLIRRGKRTRSPRLRGRTSMSMPTRTTNAHRKWITRPVVGSLLPGSILGRRTTHRRRILTCWQRQMLLNGTYPSISTWYLTISSKMEVRLIRRQVPPFARWATTTVGIGVYARPFLVLGAWRTLGSGVTRELMTRPLSRRKLA